MDLKPVSKQNILRIVLVVRGGLMRGYLNTIIQMAEKLVSFSAICIIVFRHLNHL